MPRKKIDKGSSLSVSEAATKIGVSSAAVRNWLRDEKQLKAAITVKEGVTLLPPRAMTILSKIRERRLKSASPALQMAWAARRAGKGKVARKAKAGRARTKGGKAVNPGLEKAWAARRRNAAARRAAKAKGIAAIPKAIGLSGVQAARKLGVTKVKLYDVLKRSGIKKSRGARSFTPDIIEQVRSAMSEGRKTAGRIGAVAIRRLPEPVRSSAIAAGAAGDRAITQALGIIERLSGDFRQTVERMFEQQRDLLEKALKPVRLRVEGD